jgi:hypothetical protein
MPHWRHCRIASHRRDGHPVLIASGILIGAGHSLIRRDVMRYRRNSL